MCIHGFDSNCTFCQHRELAERLHMTDNPNHTTADTNDALRDLARELYADDNLHVNHGAAVEHTQACAWVQAWVRVPFDREV